MNNVVSINKVNNILFVELDNGEARKFTLAHPITIKTDTILGWKIISAEALKVGDIVLNPKGTI